MCFLKAVFGRQEKKNKSLLNGYRIEQKLNYNIMYMPGGRRLYYVYIIYALVRINSKPFYNYIHTRRLVSRTYITSFVTAVKVVQTLL